GGITLAAGATLGVAGTIAAAGTAVLLSINDVLRLESGWALQGTVAGGGGNTLALGGTAPFTFSLPQIATTFADFQTLRVDPGATVTQTGTGTLASGVTLTVFGTLINDGTMITGLGKLKVDPASLINHGYIGGTVTLVDSSYLGNSATGTIAGGTFAVIAPAQAGVAATVVNYGNIASANTFGGVGISLAAGRVANLGSAAQVTGYFNGVKIFYDAGTVTNSGTIAASQGVGVVLAYGGPVANYAGGLIRGGTGIALFTGSPSGFTIGEPGIVTNAGTIVGTAGPGVSFAASGTVILSGTISGSGGTAIQFGGTNAYFGATGGNLLVLEFGYDLVGGVYGSVSATNTVELLGTVGAGVTVDYNGLGLTNFEDVLFSGGGYATLLVTNTTGTLGVTISGFDQTSEVIDLTGSAATGRSAISTPSPT
ncbi:MAG TPA: hypothetical protein VGQ90_05165, partial [Stellaceae bacterium]|nr:hypothetical protein [Stellaceae bacterium]